MHAVTISREHHCISKPDIRGNALKVLNRLNKAGFDSYLVGGCVRDLLLRLAPKDFDVATEAHPEQVKELFRNCRLIGRRFRLAHIFFGREIIEVATFRKDSNHQNHENKRSDQGLIVRDNVYGEIHEDAWRRDFTINALYYDINSNSIIDITQGMPDIEAKIIRLIGDPQTRYQEDPVRMLRAIRFAAKLDFSIHPDTAKPISHMADLLMQVSNSRLFDEIVKLYHSGYALKVNRMLLKYNLLPLLFPQTHQLLTNNKQSTLNLIEETLKNTDKRIRAQKPVTPFFIFAALLWHPMLRERDRLVKAGSLPFIALQQAMELVIKKQCKKTSIPKRLTQAMQEMWFIQFRFEHRKGKRAFRTLHHPRFRAAYDFLLIRSSLGEEKSELAEWWTKFQFADEKQQKQMTHTQKKNHD